MKGKIDSYRSYGNYYSSKAEIFFPENIEELKRIIEFARQQKRKITAAGSFNSFDNQNSGSDMVVSLKKINFIHYNNHDHTIECGPGANWGELIKVAYTHFSTFFTVITGSKPTAGGTLSAHTNSVWTPGCGKEGKHCIEFDLLTTSGQILTCSRNQNSDLFYGVIAGLGLLGFITRIKYQLFHVGKPFEIKISGKIYSDIIDIESRFYIRESAQFNQLEDLKSQGSLFYLDGDTAKFGVFDRSYQITSKPQKFSSKYFFLGSLTMPIIRFMPQFANRMMIKDEKRKPENKRVLKGLNKIYYGTLYAEPDYIWSKFISKPLQAFGYTPKLYQNSYFIPLEKNKVTEFTQKTCELLLKYKLQFGMFDIMYIPKDEPFILSASRYTDGFYINTTFFDRTNVKQLMLFYQELNELCIAMGGKMNLTKNLFIDTRYLENMYGKEVQEMLELKKITDPDNLISSNFFKEKFPSFFNQ